MKKQFCRAAAILTLLSIGMTASCGNEVDQEKDVGGESTESTSAAPETSYLDTIEMKKFDGKEFVIYAPDLSVARNFDDGEVNGEVVNDALYNRERKVEELLDIKIIDKPTQDRGQLKKEVQTAVLAQEEPCQMIMTSIADGINTLMPNGILYDLSMLPYINLDKEWWNQNLRNNLTFSGHIYAVTGPISKAYYSSPVVTAFNIKLAEDYGFENLYDVVLDNKWTIDKYNDLIKFGTDDIDGSGDMTDKDRYALILDEEDGKALFVSAGGTLTDNDGKGNYYLNLDSEKNLNVLEKIRTIFGNRDNSYFVPSIDDKNILMFTESRATFAILSMGNLLRDFREMKDDFGILPLPKLDENQDDYITYGNPWVSAGVAIPATCSDTDLAGLVMEILAYVSYNDLQPAVYEATLREKLTRDESSKDMLDIIYRDIYFDLNSIYNFGNSSDHLRKYAVGAVNTGFVSTYASIKTKAETELQKIIDAQAELDG